MFSIVEKCSFIPIGSRFPVIPLFSLLVAIVTGATSSNDTITLINIPDVAAPVVEDQKMLYTVYFMFDRCPKDYWFFYDDSSSQLVIELVGVHVLSDEMRISGTPIIKNPSVSNHETDLAFNRKKAQIRFDMNDPWHYDEGWVIDGKILRLKLWMPLNVGKDLKTKKSWPYILGVSGVLVAGIITWLISILPE